MSDMVGLSSGGAVSWDSLEARRALVVDLGAAIRDLAEASVGCEVSEADLVVATKAVRSVSDALGAVQRRVGDVSSVDDLTCRVRMFNPISGPASPVAPPLRVDPEQDDGRCCLGRVVLGLAQEGPFTYAHGGVTAALLDDILGRLASSLGQPVVTSKLSVRYRAPVPLRVPLLVVGTTIAVDGRRFTLRGTVAPEEQPDMLLAEAEGLFVALDDEQATALFGSSDLHGTGLQGTPSTDAYLHDTA